MHLSARLDRPHLAICRRLSAGCFGAMNRWVGACWGGGWSASLTAAGLRGVRRSVYDAGSSGPPSAPRSASWRWPIALSALPLLFSDPTRWSGFNAFFIPWVSTLGLPCCWTGGAARGAALWLSGHPRSSIFFSTGTLAHARHRDGRLKQTQGGRDLVGAAPLRDRLARAPLARARRDRCGRDDGHRASGAVRRLATDRRGRADRRSRAGAGAAQSPRGSASGAATVDARRVGGVRTGLFEGGLRFVEKIPAYEPERRLLLDVGRPREHLATTVAASRLQRALTWRAVVSSVPAAKPLPGGTRLSLAPVSISLVVKHCRFWMGHDPARLRGAPPPSSGPRRGQHAPHAPPAAPTPSAAPPTALQSPALARSARAPSCHHMPALGPPLHSPSDSPGFLSHR